MNLIRIISRPTCLLVATGLVASLLVSSAQGQGRKKNPTSKLFVADVSGEAQIDTGETIDTLSKRSVYNAQGTVIETKDKSTNSMVFSNATGVYLDPDTRLEVRKFVQEPFTPSRHDTDVEPSISTTQNFLARGTVGVCTSKLVAGSTMTYGTPQGSVQIRGSKSVIETNSKGTVVSLLEGDVTVRGGSSDGGGQVLKPGQQAFIPSNGGAVQIRPIPPAQMKTLDDKVSMACMARKTVYFEARQSNEQPGAGGKEAAVTAFDQEGADNQEIVPVVTTPTDIPVQYTVSAANITSQKSPAQ